MNYRIYWATCIKPCGSRHRDIKCAYYHFYFCLQKLVYLHTRIPRVSNCTKSWEATTGINDKRPLKFKNKLFIYLFSNSNIEATNLSEQNFVSEGPVDISRVEEREAEFHCPVKDFNYVVVLPGGAVEGWHSHASQPDRRNLQALRSKLHSGDGRHSWRNLVQFKLRSTKQCKRRSPWSLQWESDSSLSIVARVFGFGSLCLSSANACLPSRFKWQGPDGWISSSSGCGGSFSSGCILEALLVLRFSPIVIGPESWLILSRLYSCQVRILHPSCRVKLCYVT